jgi:hypothetical protein
MPTHAVIKLKIFEFFKTSNKYPKIKDFKKSFWKLANGFKNNNNIFFIPDLAHKKNFSAGSACTNSNFRGKKLRNHDENETISNFLLQSKSRLPMEVLWCKNTRIHEIENLALGHLSSSQFIARERKFL